MPDARLDALAELFQPPKVTHATVEYLDFPAISKEALRDPSYLASLRVVDALAHVLRVFESDTVPHEKGSVDPLRDLDDVEIELILSDLVVVEKRLERLDKDRKKIKNPDLDHEFELLERVQGRARSQPPLREMTLDADDEKRIRGFQFLSQKPMLYVLNLGEERRRRGCTRSRPSIATVRWRARRNTGVTAVCGKIEAELAELPPRGGARVPGQLRAEGVRPGAPHLGHLLRARADVVPHGGRRRGARLDHPDELHRGEGRRRHPHRLREEVHPRRSGELEDAGR